MSDVSEQGYIVGSTERPAEELQAGLPQFQSNDTLVAKITPCFENGKGALVGVLPCRYGVGSTEFHVVRPNSSADPAFLYWLTRSNNFRHLGRQNMTGSAGQRRVPAEFLKSFSILLPPLAEQKKIAEILGVIDAAITATRRVIEQTRNLKRALMQEFLTRGIPGRHTHFKDSPLGKIPIDWTVTTYGGVSKVVRGGSPRPAGDARYFNGSFVPWITVGEITKDDDVFLHSTETKLTKEGSERSRMVPAGTLLVTNSGFSLGIPKITLVEGCINDGVAALVDVKPETKVEFLYWHLRTLTHKLRNSVARGVEQINLNTTLISELPIALPGLTEQVEIVAALKRATSKEITLGRELEQIDCIRRALLPTLLLGDVRVPLASDAKKLATG